jgi:predicted DNA-binding protein (UPF0251 family)
MSPRPKKSRNCSCPHRPTGAQLFKPAGIPSSELVKVQLMLDELEALRLCDDLGLSQADAGVQMGVSRGTVQRLVKCGRKKLVTAIVNSQALIIMGFGDCDQTEIIG